jgi:hypothetical protein
MPYGIGSLTWGGYRSIGARLSASGLLSIRRNPTKAFRVGSGQAAVGLTRQAGVQLQHLARPPRPAPPGRVARSRKVPPRFDTALSRIVRLRTRLEQTLSCFNFPDLAVVLALRKDHRLARQPHRLALASLAQVRRAFLSSRVAAASTVPWLMTTPYCSRATSGENKPSSTFSRTAAGSRRSGSP